MLVVVELDPRFLWRLSRRGRFVESPGAAVGTPGDVTTTVALSGRAATGCTVQVTATVAGSSALGLGSDIPPVQFWDDWNLLGSVTPTVNRATPTTGVSLNH
ncbi:hypothetical protein OH799_08540 [Nocardia sp. NBC_00881]|uniref:hypothetical protein n=1 Tax=Nocardia sp. NBC_00881 TaxID=2975995 RepID=UPI0038631A0B|nr:hypothetical protein OH799_08540 [Nocardia sp. NBC_00881]